MSRYGQYNDSWRPRNSQNGLDLKAEYLAPLDEEAEALYRLMEASKWLRPSVVVGLARASNTDKQFLLTIRMALMAAHSPEMAEVFAGEAIECFSHDEAHAADTAYNLVLLSAMTNDADWERESTLTREVFKMLEGLQ